MFFWVFKNIWVVVWVWITVNVKNTKIQTAAMNFGEEKNQNLPYTDIYSAYDIITLLFNLQVLLQQKIMAIETDYCSL